MPAITAAGDDPFRWSILTRLAGVELLRARTVAVAAEILAQPRDPARTSVRTADLIETVLADVSPEARLRGVRVDVSGLDPAYTMALDGRLVRCALSGLLQSMLALVKGDGAVVQVRVTGTTIRPALIVEVAQDAVDVDPDAIQRFFEGDWREHPCGASGALRLAATARTARLHGGRVDVKAVSPRGCAVTFVIPRPLD
jgi:signal transduction histidine kinase